MRALLVFLCPLRAALAAGGEEAEEVRVDEVSRDARTRFVGVKIEVRKDEGDEPDGAGVHGYFVDQQRPAWLAGVVWSDREVLCPDPCVPARFVKSVSVVVDGREARAEFHGFLRRARACLLRTDGPLAERTPVSFVPPPDDPYAPLWAAALRRDDPGWRLHVDAVPSGQASLFGKPEPELEFRGAGSDALIYGEEGPLVGYTPSGRLLLRRGGEPWRGVDLRREQVVTIRELDEALGRLRERLEKAALEVRLTFRREEKEGAGAGFGRTFFRGFHDRVRDESANEWKGTGFLVGPRRVLVAADLARDPLIRTEKIEVRAGSDWRNAEFVGALRDFGAVVVEVEGSPLEGALDLAAAAEFRRDELLLSAVVDHATGRRRVRAAHDRLSSWDEGYKGRVHAATYRDEKEGQVAFTPEGELLGLCFSFRREPGEDRGYTFDGPYLLAAAEVERALRREDPFDPALRPLPKKEEKRLVWLGVEFQGLDQDLARANEAEVPTKAGKLGLLVTHIYAGSPAERLGLERWDILLRVEAEGQGRPVDLEGSRASIGFRPDYFGFFDRIPEEHRAAFLSRMPPPWPARRNFLTELLTRFGEGTSVKLTYLRGGEERESELALEKAPTDFESAAKFKSEELGFTVKEVTYEVRHYFRLGEDETVLVVAGVEPGGKAALGKVSPYVLLRRVNGEPVRTVDEFENLYERAKGGAEPKVLELTVERFGKTRLVKIKL
jgi:hypothetical protein